MNTFPCTATRRAGSIPTTQAAAFRLRWHSLQAERSEEIEAGDETMQLAQDPICTVFLVTKNTECYRDVNLILCNMYSGNPQSAEHMPTPPAHDEARMGPSVLN